MMPTDLRLAASQTPRARAVRAHRLLRGGMLAISAALLPALWLGSILSPRNPGLMVAILAVGVGAWFALGVVLYRFRCPSCGQQFHRAGWHLDLFTKQCVRCGTDLRR